MLSEGQHWAQWFVTGVWQTPCLASGLLQWQLDQSYVAVVSQRGVIAGPVACNCFRASRPSLVNGPQPGSHQHAWGDQAPKHREALPQPGTKKCQYSEFA